MDEKCPVGRPWRCDAGPSFVWRPWGGGPEIRNRLSCCRRRARVFCRRKENYVLGFPVEWKRKGRKGGFGGGAEPFFSFFFNQETGQIGGALRGGAQVTSGSQTRRAGSSPGSCLRNLCCTYRPRYGRAIPDDAATRMETSTSAWSNIQGVWRGGSWPLRLFTQRHALIGAFVNTFLCLLCNGLRRLVAADDPVQSRSWAVASRGRRRQSAS